MVSYYACNTSKWNVYMYVQYKFTVFYVYARHMNFLVPIVSPSDYTLYIVLSDNACPANAKYAVWNLKWNLLTWECVIFV